MAPGLAWLKACGALTMTWWRETTDRVVLNSPWLRRDTGRFFRCMSISLHGMAWFYCGFQGGGILENEAAKNQTVFFSRRT